MMTEQQRVMRQYVRERENLDDPISVAWRKEAELRAERERIAVRRASSRANPATEERAKK